MPETFKAKVRSVGTSLGILIPKEVVAKEKIRMGEVVDVNLLRWRSKKETEEAVSRLFGSAGGAKPFRREHINRVFK
jgi:hypothetical protein